MSTTYTSNPNSTQAPSGPPVDRTAPKATLPADGDPAIAASVAQMAKVALDQIAFLQAPFAKGGVPALEIWKWSDEKGNKRGEIDHWGFIRKATTEWTEDFTPAPGWNQIGTGTLNVGRQSVVVAGAGGASYSAAPSFAYSNPPYPASLVGTVAPDASRQFVGIIDGGAGGNRTEVRLNDNYVTATFADDTLISCEWDFENFTNLDQTWSIGFAGEGEFVSAISHGIYFYRPDAGSANWHCRTVNGGTPSDGDSGVLAGPGRHVFRIDFVGANLVASGVAQAIFWIDGTPVITLASSLPINNGTWAIPVAGGATTSGVANPVFLLNAIRYRQINAIALT